MVFSSNVAAQPRCAANTAGAAGTWARCTRQTTTALRRNPSSRRATDSPRIRAGANPGRQHAVCLVGGVCADASPPSHAPSGAANALALGGMEPSQVWDRAVVGHALRYGSSDSHKAAGCRNGFCSRVHTDTRLLGVAHVKPGTARYAHALAADSVPMPTPAGGGHSCTALHHSGSSCI